ncbi:sugar phosphate isomerase/epimerase [Roseiconus nitratireducens]|uniref:Sugar phosphate isomerase/epimerase n=1 Tax=Roseiconus nitratireducens TaxID=2605748 RepID=A0A5M6DDE6_9BACT|nr:sugar phosphate isomerase/epimerase family protein [Roseiconus nitratireducens]KAA5544486.1 sugar phosphate isomerase/epimerase [Roseiconus nitratireducens]
MNIRRREFLALSAAALAGHIRPAAAADAAKTENTLCVFTKPFNSLSFDRLAEAVAELGFDGIEAPIRKGGHIEPEQAADELPKLVEALAQHNLEVTVLTSDINDPQDPLTEKVLRTAATLGIRRYRMKYVRYDDEVRIDDQLANWRDQFRDLAALNHDYGVTGLYQNHAGRNYMGAPLWDLARVLEGINPADLAVAYDIRHATVEGGTSWPTTFRMIAPHVDTVYVKDFVWKDGQVQNVPLGQGRVDPSFFSMLRRSGFLGPISLHEEYLDHRDADLVPQHLQAIQQDLKTLRAWITA